MDSFDVREIEVQLLRAQLQERDLAIKLEKAKANVMEQKLKLEIAQLNAKLTKQNSKSEIQKRKRRSKSLPSPEDAIWIPTEPLLESPKVKERSRSKTRLNLNFSKMGRSSPSSSVSPKHRNSPLRSSDCDDAREIRRLSPKKPNSTVIKRTIETAPILSKSDPIEVTITQRKSVSLPTKPVELHDSSEAYDESSIEHSVWLIKFTERPSKYDIFCITMDQGDLYCDVCAKFDLSQLIHPTTGRYEGTIVYFPTPGDNTCLIGECKIVGNKDYDIFIVYISNNDRKAKQITSPVYIKSECGKFNISKIVELYEHMHKLFFI